VVRHLLKLYALGFLDAFHGQAFRPVLLHLLVQILLLQVVLIFHGLCGMRLLFMVEQLVELSNHQPLILPSSLLSCLLAAMFLNIQMANFL